MTDILESSCSVAIDNEQRDLINKTMFHATHLKSKLITGCCSECHLRMATNVRISLRSTDIGDSLTIKILILITATQAGESSTEK